MLRRTLKVGILAALFITAALLAAPANTAWASPAVGNSFAVCPCGAVFVPDSTTKYLEANGKRYACCSEGCYKMAMLDQAGSAKLAEDNMAKAMSQARVDVGVANVIAVNEKGATALCGCGTEFTLGAMTPYLKYGGKTYACCSQACHDLAAKDPAAGAKMIEAKLAQKMP
ncbi:MAG: hypothetical protein HY304_00775 [candidate division Zixibacteria bacterium]|nr:hypothetical protein [candidate division Zixibacteria bacterium]